jgi:predicted GTPase
MKTAVVRHPMPYGDLARQIAQRFASPADLDYANCTLEEREEYEPHLAIGNTVFAGVDYARVLAAAESEAEVILWDGGNNDFPFLKPDVLIVMIDPMRPGHELTYHPGEAVLRAADVVLIAKCNSAPAEAIESVAANCRALAPRAEIIRGASHVTLDNAQAARGKRVLVVDDGPTLTHGGMPYGAGHVAAVEAGASEIVDPRESAVGEIADLYRRYPHIGRALPAMGYSPAELGDLHATIKASRAEVVVCGTPVDLGRVIQIDQTVLRARYEFSEAGAPRLAAIVDATLAAREPGAAE